MGNLALTLRDFGQAAEAETLHWQEFEIKTRVLGPDHLDTVNCIGNLALALKSQGRFAEAESLHRQDYEIRK
jgi:hypothetical protein